MTDKLSERTPQTKLDALKGLPDSELLEKAWAEISALCGAGKGPQKRWTMSVPVNADRDSDVLFGEVLRRFDALRKRAEGLEQFAKTVVEFAENNDELGIDDERDWQDEALKRDKAITEWLLVGKDVLAEEQP